MNNKNLYRALKTSLDGADGYGLAKPGDLVEIKDDVKARQLVVEGQMEKVTFAPEAQFITKVEQVQEKAVEVTEAEEKPKAGRPKKESE